MYIISINHLQFVLPIEHFTLQSFFQKLINSESCFCFLLSNAKHSKPLIHSEALGHPSIQIEHTNPAAGPSGKCKTKETFRSSGEIRRPWVASERMRKRIFDKRKHARLGCEFLRVREDSSRVWVGRSLLTSFDGISSPFVVSVCWLGGVSELSNYVFLFLYFSRDVVVKN